jgi:hypothetical protein
MNLVTPLLLCAVGFLGMEAVTYVVHRFVMHGSLERLHASHPSPTTCSHLHFRSLSSADWRWAST